MRPAQIIPIGTHATIRNKAQNSLSSCGETEGSGAPPCAHVNKEPNSINGQTKRLGRRRGGGKNPDLAGRPAAVLRTGSCAPPLLPRAITNALPVLPSWPET